MAAKSHAAKSHLQLCEGVIGFVKEMDNFQAGFETLFAKLGRLQSQALEATQVSSDQGHELQELGTKAYATAKKVCLPEVPQPGGDKLAEPEEDFLISPRPVSCQARRPSVEGGRSNAFSCSSEACCSYEGLYEMDDPDEDSEEDDTPPVTQDPRRSTCSCVLDASTRLSQVSIPEPPAPREVVLLHMDDNWTEVFFQNEKEAEDQLEKIYLSVRRKSRRGNRASVSQSKEVCKMLILHPTSPIRMVFDFLEAVLLAWDLSFIPIQVAWNISSSDDGFLSELFRAALLFWTFDVVICFISARYTKSGELLTSFRSIGQRYALTWLPIDIAVLCVDYAILFLGNSETRDMQVLLGLRLFRLIRLAKLVKLGRIFDDFCVTNGWHALALGFKFCKIALQLYAMLHCFGCMMFFVGRISQENGEINWITTYFRAGDNDAHKYLKSVQFMLCQFSPAPFPWIAQNVYEQAILLITIVVGIPVIGSNLSSLMALVTQMNAKASESTRIQQELEQYIMVHNFPSELSSKILHSIMYMVKSKSRSVPRPSSLSMLPHDLSVELSLEQAGQVLMIHPFVGLIMSAKLDIVSDLCAAFNFESVLPKCEVFHAGDTATSMYITCQGTYSLLVKEKIKRTFAFDHEGSQGLEVAPRVQKLKSMSSGESILSQVSFSQPHWFSELALFTKFTHTSSLVPMTFGDTYNILATSFASVIKGSPITAVAAYEYAKGLLSKVNNDADLPSRDNLPSEMCVSSATSTELSEAVSPGREGNEVLDAALSMIPQRSKEMDYAPMQEFVSGLLAGRTLSDLALQEMLPELHETLGTYHAFKHLEERKCCVLSIFSAVWLARDNYDAIASIQVEDKRLQHATWSLLRNFIEWVDLDDDMLHGAIVFLTIRGLGKSKMFNHMCPPPARKCPEYGVAYVMENERALLPSVELLPARVYHLVRSAVLLNKNFNFAQLVQGENIPYSVALLEEIIEDQGEELLKFYLFVMVCVMSGLTGKVSLEGSLFLTEQNATNLLDCVQNLQACGRRHPSYIYWGYIRKRARQLDLNRTSSEDLTFARLVCLSRTMDSKGLGILKEAWEKLEPFDKQSLVNWFTADGITSQALIFTFLPNYLSNAIANPSIGLHFAFLNLIDLLDRLEDYMDKAQAMVYTIDLADFAAMIPSVATPQGLCECIKHVKIVRKDTRISLVLTGECRQAVAKVAWRRVRDRSRGEVSIDSTPCVFGEFSM